MEVNFIPWVYPRVCGGTDGLERVCQGGQGLSPRVRGNLVWRDVDIETIGSIPACAGEPVRPFSSLQM